MLAMTTLAHPHLLRNTSHLSLSSFVDIQLFQEVECFTN